MTEAIVFYSFACVAVLSALGVVLLRNSLHCALLLGLCLSAVAGIFGTLGADFLFAAQLLVYVGGVAVLVLFVVLLSGRSSELRLRQVNDQWLAGILLCSAAFWGMWRYISSYGDDLAASPAGPSTAALGRLLCGNLAVPFELVSLVLVAALIGAVLFTRPVDDPKKESSHETE